MCQICVEEHGHTGYGDLDQYEDITTAQAVIYLAVMSPFVAYIFLRDAVFGGARRRARKQRGHTKITRKQKRIFKEWSGR